MRITRLWRQLVLALVAIAAFAAFGASSGVADDEGPSLRDPTEFPGTAEAEDGPTAFEGTIVHRSFSRPGKAGAAASSAKKAKSNPELGVSFDGLNLLQQRYANHQNQFTVEPPDQGLCVGNGYVFETVNDVLNVFDRSGNRLLPDDTNTAPIPHVNGAVDLNTFFGYPAAINRGTLVRGPIVTDPSCLFDQATQRWFFVVLTLDAFPNGQTMGPNHLDIAVSNGPNPIPLSNWTIYRIPVQNDGTQGTPDHHCNPRNPALPPRAGNQPTNPRACIADYPHIGADANGFYITANEYDFFGDQYQSANIYAFSKTGLENGDTSHVLLETKNTVHGQPGFTVWPATSPPNQFATDAGGTEYFMSSNAADEATCPTGCEGPRTSDELVVWSLTNTSSLNTATPDVHLTNKVLSVLPYGVPPRANQKPGSVPLADCLNDTTLPTPFGPGCWQILLLAEPPHNQVEGAIDANDSRMQQVWYANGKLWGALDTALTLEDHNKAGIEWFIVKPGGSNLAGAKVSLNGYLGLAGNNVTYPAIATTPSGRGVMAFTLVGDDHYPSAAYASIDANAGVGDIHVAKEGLGPDDGFTVYPPLANPARARWGDYGAAVLDGNSIWIASEYIGQTCTFQQYVGSPFTDGTFGRLSTSFGLCRASDGTPTRGSSANWYTRISKVTP
jgi:hypothetical protein